MSQHLGEHRFECVGLPEGRRSGVVTEPPRDALPVEDRPEDISLGLTVSNE